MKKVMAGIDLHSNNLVVGIMDAAGKRLGHQRLPCELTLVRKYLAPYKSRLEKVAVESTFNWYWLVDGLQALGYPVVLANPAKMEQYNGLKHADDTHDAFFLAEMLRLNILPTGYIYDPALRPLRDLLRRRILLVHQRSTLMISFKSLYARTTGQEMPLGRLKQMEVEQAQKLYEHPADQLIAGLQIGHIEQLAESIAEIEKVVLQYTKKLDWYPKLTTLPGIGRILGMTIAMEVGDIKRFATPGQWASYCRTVEAKRISNEKKKGDNNSKCGNKYLAWAFVEGSQFARRHDEDCRRWFDRKAAKTNPIIATKALACKLAKAAWYAMAEGAEYDSRRMFGTKKNNAKKVKS